MALGSIGRAAKFATRMATAPARKGGRAIGKSARAMDNASGGRLGSAAGKGGFAALVGGAAVVGGVGAVLDPNGTWADASETAFGTPEARGLPRSAARAAITYGVRGGSYNDNFADMGSYYGRNYNPYASSRERLRVKAGGTPDGSIVFGAYNMRRGY